MPGKTKSDSKRQKVTGEVTVVSVLDSDSESDVEERSRTLGAPPELGAPRELGALKEQIARQQAQIARQQEQIDSMQPDPKTTNPRPMSHDQVVNLGNLLRQAHNNQTFQHKFKTIILLKDDPTPNADGDIDLKELHPRQQWLLHFVSRIQEPFKLDHIITEEERSTVKAKSATKKAPSVELPADQQPPIPSTPDSSSNARHEMKGIMCEQYMSISEASDDDADVSKADDDDDDVSKAYMFGDDCGDSSEEQSD